MLLIFSLKYVLNAFVVMIYPLSFKNLLINKSFSKHKNLSISSLNVDLNFFKHKKLFVSSLDADMNFLNTTNFEIKMEVISSDVLFDASSIGLFHGCSPHLKFFFSYFT